MNQKLSIVIPAYNAAKTVEKTVWNVLASSNPVAVYVVDDGSKDETSAILDRIADEVKVKSLGEQWNGSSLIVIHQENSGAYQARLNALKQIKTPYFGFVDADDMIELTMFEKMLTLAEKENLDVVQVGIDGGRNNNRGIADGKTVIEGEILERWKYSYLVDAYDSCFIWDKLYRNQYDFSAFEPTDRITCFDDMVFNFQFFAKIKRMGFIREKLYHYAKTEGGAVRGFSKKKTNDFKWMIKNHWRLCKALFASGEYSMIKLWIGHIKWSALNRRNHIISKVRAMVRR